MLGVISPQAIDTGPDLGLSGVPSAELHARYVEARRRETRAAAEAAALLGEITRRGSYRRDGYLSATAFVAHTTGDSGQTAAGRVRVARTLQEMPATAAAYREGEIDVTRVRRLIDAHDAAPGRFREDEDRLVERARSQDAADFAATVARWTETAAADAAARRETEAFERRRLTMTDTLWGTVHLDAELDPIAAETVRVAIGSLAGPADRDHHDGSDGRTPPQRRADALMEICRYFLDTAEYPTSNGRRPHLDVIVDLDTLTGARSEIGHRRPLGPGARQMLACDATICGVLMDQGERVLQMGRRARTATPAQHRALAIRDRGCVVPGCGRSPEWCDAHHRIPWTRGGPTDLDNLALICRPHHVMLHYGSLRLPSRE